VPYWIVNYAATKAPVKWLKKILIGVDIINEEYEEEDEESV